MRGRVSNFGNTALKQDWPTAVQSRFNYKSEMVSSVSSYFYCRSCGAEGIYYNACNVTGLSFWVSRVQLDSLSIPIVKWCQMLCYY